jgi:hypothetical protein
MGYGGQPKGAPQQSGSANGSYAGGSASASGGSGGVAGAAADLSGIASRLDDLVDAVGTVASAVAVGEFRPVYLTGFSVLVVAIGEVRHVSDLFVGSDATVVNYGTLYIHGTFTPYGAIYNYNTMVL